MYISHKYKLIFMRFPRVASKTLIDLFRSLDGGKGFYIGPGSGYAKYGNGHIRARHIKKLWPELWEEYTKIVFVRNPWDRHVSLFHHFRRDFQLNSFLDLINLTVRDGDKAQYLAPCEDYVFDPADGSVYPDFIGYYEELQTSLDRVCELVGAPTKIITEHYHRSACRKPYPGYYTEPWMIEQVREFHGPDMIRRLGYEFGEEPKAKSLQDHLLKIQHR